MRPMLTCAVMVVACLAQTALGGDPLDNWTTSNIGPQSTLSDVAYGNGQFVAVGGAGRILTSPDGDAWTPRLSGTSNALYGLTYGNGQFVAVGASGTILNSADGTTWTQRSSGSSDTLVGVAFGNGLFVSVDGMRPGGVYSVDGAGWGPWHWTMQNPQTDPPALTGIAYGAGQFVVVYPGAQLGQTVPSLATSADGVTWTQYVNSGPLFAGSLAFGNGQFVAAGGYFSAANNHLQYHGVIYSSPDGVNWTRREDLSNGNGGGFSGLAYGGGQFAVGGAMIDPTNSSAMIYSSPDATNWVAHDVQIGVSAIGYGDGRFVALGLNGVIMRSGVIGRLEASLSPANGVRGAITGVTGQNYAIKASTNLTAWTVLTNVTITNGTAQFNDSGAANFSRRFYQAVLMQP